MVANPFDSPRRLLARARKHIADFDAGGMALSKIHPWTGDVHHKGRRQGRWEFVLLPPPAEAYEELSDIAFDIVSNLRAALDQAAYASAVTIKGGNPKQTKFPFGDSKAEAVGDATRGGRDLDPDIRDLLLAFRPYPSGNVFLWGLNKLRNAKLHKSLVAHDVMPFCRVERYSAGAKPAGRWGPVWRPSRRQLVVCHYPIGTALDVAFDFSFEMAIGASGGPLSGQPAMATFNSLASEIEGIVMAIEAETARIIRERNS